jgi:hypothetical protein
MRLYKFIQVAYSHPLFYVETLYYYRVNPLCYVCTGYENSLCRPMEYVYAKCFCCALPAELQCMSRLLNRDHQRCLRRCHWHRQVNCRHLRVTMDPPSIIVKAMDNDESYGNTIVFTVLKIELTTTAYEPFHVRTWRTRCKYAMH